MPELPEVEVTKRGISGVLNNAVIKSFVIYQSKLRENVSSEFKTLHDLQVLKLERRAKYILITTNQGVIILHLGMTGNLKVITANNLPINPTKHDIADIVLDNGGIIRFNDQRKFGLLQWVPSECSVADNKWIKNLGIEPLSSEFSKIVLYNLLHTRKTNIKSALMNNSIIVGIGNIYANEILFLSKISPFRKCCDLTIDECDVLTKNIVTVLEEAISKGGTTIKDFSNVDGKLGYFVQELKVYGKADTPCCDCGEIIQSQIINQRNTFYCPNCQK
jgi:formamidopyrimidine-DNA glycosylase